MTAKTVGQALGISGNTREVPCEHCGATITIDQDIWEMGKAFSRILLERGETALQANELARCEDCTRAFKRAREAHANKWAEYIAGLRRRVNESLDQGAIAKLLEKEPGDETERLIRAATVAHGKHSSRKGGF